jgi:integrase
MKIKGLYKMPGSRFYWYRWSQGAKRRAVSLKTEDLAEAILAVRKIQAGELFARWERAEPVDTPMTHLVEKYLSTAQNRAKKPMRPRTAKKQGAVLLKFLRDTGIATFNEITPAAITRWLEGLKKTKVSADTLHTYAIALRTFVKFLGQDVSKFDIPERTATGRKNWLQLEVVNRVIADSKDPDLTFILLCGFHAGLRKSEIIAAKVNWFDLSASLLHVQNDPASGFILKDRENRVIPLTHEFKEFLVGFLGQRDGNSYVLRPGQGRGANEYRYDFKRALYSHFKRCGVECSIHDMRRSFASNLVSRGVSIYKVARWLGDGVAVVEKSYGYLAPADRDIDALSLA